MYAHLKPGTRTVVEDTETYQRVIHRSKAGWTEEIVWKPGYEPVVEPSETDRLHAKIDALTERLHQKGALTPADVAAIRAHPRHKDT